MRDVPEARKATTARPANRVSYGGGTEGRRNSHDYEPAGPGRSGRCSLHSICCLSTAVRPPALCDCHTRPVSGTARDRPRDSDATREIPHVNSAARPGPAVFALPRSKQQRSGLERSNPLKASEAKESQPRSASSGLSSSLFTGFSQTRDDLISCH